MGRKNEIVVVGAGRFGSEVIKKLAEVSKYTLIVIDQKREKVDALAKYVDNGYVTNLTIEENLDSLGLKNAGTWIIGIGDNVQDSLLIASLIKKKYKSARIIAKATDQNHIDILKTLGIQEVISPEQAAARWAIVKIINPTLNKDISESYIHEIDGGLAMIRTPVLDEYVDKQVKDLDFPSGITINVIYRKGKPIIVNGLTEIKNNDELLLMGKAKQVYKFASEVNATKKLRK